MAFNNVISLTVSGLYSSYLVCCVLFLWRRCTGGIGRSSQDPPGKIGLHWGPFRIQASLGIAVKRRCLRVHGHCHLFQLLATGDANNCGPHEL